MSLTISFEKVISLEDIKNKTTIVVEEKDNEYWLSYNKSKILIDLFDKKTNSFSGLTRYGLNDLTVIMNQIVITFQTRFLDCDGQQHFFNEPTLDLNELYDKTLTKYGYSIDESGLISLK